jgi:hypothetical protein
MADIGLVKFRMTASGQMLWTSLAISTTTGIDRRLRAKAGGPRVSPTPKRPEVGLPASGGDGQDDGVGSLQCLLSVEGPRHGHPRVSLPDHLFQQIADDLERLLRDVVEHELAVVETADDEHVAHDPVDELVRGADEDDALAPRGAFIAMMPRRPTRLA